MWQFLLRKSQPSIYLYLKLYTEMRYLNYAFKQQEKWPSPRQKICLDFSSRSFYKFLDFSGLQTLSRQWDGIRRSSLHTCTLSLPPSARVDFIFLWFVKMNKIEMKRIHDSPGTRGKTEKPQKTGRWDEVGYRLLGFPTSARSSADSAGFISTTQKLLSIILHEPGPRIKLVMKWNIIRTGSSGENDGRTYVIWILLSSFI